MASGAGSGAEAGGGAYVMRPVCPARVARNSASAVSKVVAPCDYRNVPLDFTAIDFETANGSAASACSVGLVKVRDGRVVDSVSWFIQPPLGHDVFNEWNIRIHGIQPADVANVVHFLVSPASDMISGQNIAIDGGW